MTTDADPTTTDPTPPEQVADTAAEVEKWKAMARKHEAKSKENSGAAAELEKLRQQSMSDQEKAVAQAVAQATAETRASVLREVGSTLVDAQIRLAAKDLPLNVDRLLDGLDRGRFLGDDGQPDGAAIVSYVAELVPTAEPPKPPGFPDLGQGARGQHPSSDPATEFANFLSKQGVR